MDETNSPVNKLACDITRIFYRDLAQILSQEVLLSVIYLHCIIFVLYFNVFGPDTYGFFFSLKPNTFVYIM